jgi:hypothetical protein
LLSAKSSSSSSQLAANMCAANAVNGNFELPGPSTIGYWGTTPTLGDQGGSGWTFDTVGGTTGIGKPGSLAFAQPHTDDHLHGRFLLHGAYHFFAFTSLRIWMSKA